MCQKSNLQEIRPLRGIIVFTDKNKPLFMATDSNPFPKFKTITNAATLKTFVRFVDYCISVGVLVKKGYIVKCDYATITALYTEFEELEFNRSINAILWRNEISHQVPQVNALRSEVNGSLNYWLKNARNWLQQIRLRVLPSPIKL